MVGQVAPGIEASGLPHPFPSPHNCCVHADSSYARSVAGHGAQAGWVGTGVQAQLLLCVSPTCQPRGGELGGKGEEPLTCSQGRGPGCEASQKG